MPLVVSEGVVQVNVILPYTVGDAVSEEVLSASLLLGLTVLLATRTFSIDTDQDVLTGVGSVGIVVVHGGESYLEGPPLQGACTCPSRISEAV